jgi:antitoxin (DNA-binding transcriptional repressor) of toxin-antitoxin stability system
LLSRYIGLVKSISQQEFHDNFVAVMDAVESGDAYFVTRNGVEVVELRPLVRRRRQTAEELVAEHRKLPRLDSSRLRADIDE